MSEIGILGTGTWGTAISRILANAGHNVVMWSAIVKEIDNLSSTYVHPNLEGMLIPRQIQFTKNIEKACKNKDVLIFAVPSVFVRTTAGKAAAYIPNDQIIVDIGKGIEPDTLFTLTSPPWRSTACRPCGTECCRTFRTWWQPAYPKS